MAYLIVTLLLAVPLVLKIFGPAMAAILPLASDRRKLGWTLWFVSLLGGLLVAYTTLAMQSQLQSLVGVSNPAKSLHGFLPDRTLTSEVILGLMPAGIALGFWHFARPECGSPASLRYKILVVAMVYVLPITASELYLFIATKGVSQ